MRRKIVIAAAVGALAVGGTAIAAPGGGPLGGVLFEGPEEREAEFARDLAGKLDGVTVEEAERALERSHAQMREGFRSGRPPEQGPFETLARELGKSRDEVRRAFEAIHRERLERELDEAVKEGRLSRDDANRIRRHAEEGPPPMMRRRFRMAPPPGAGGPGGPPPGDFVMPAPAPAPEE